MKLARLNGMTWTQAVAFMRENLHAFVFGSTEQEMRAVEASRRYGAEAGAAAAVVAVQGHAGGAAAAAVCG